MNKTYKVIFNCVTRTWTAVNEVARSRKKSSTARVLSYLLLGAAGGISSAALNTAVATEPIDEPIALMAARATGFQDAGISAYWTPEGGNQNVVRNEQEINVNAPDPVYVGILVSSGGTVDLTADQINIHARGENQGTFGILSQRPMDGSPAEVPKVNLKAKDIKIEALGGGRGIETNWGSQIKLQAENSVSVRATANEGRPKAVVVDGWADNTPSLLEIQAADISLSSSTRGETSGTVHGVYMRATGDKGHSLLLGTESNSQKVSISASASGMSDGVEGFEAQNGKAIIGSANTTVSISSVNTGFNDVTEVGSANGMKISGRDTEVVVNGSSFNVNVESGLKPTGIRVRDNGTLTVNAPTLITVKGGAPTDRASDGIRVDNAQGTQVITAGTRSVVFNKAVSVNVSAEQAVRGVAVLLGAAKNLEEGNSDQGGLITINSDLDINVASSGNNSRGIALDNVFLDGTHEGTTVTSGPGAGAELKIAGNTNIKSSAHLNAHGIHAKDKAQLNAAGNLTVSSVSDSALSYGIRTELSGNVSVSGDTINISSESKGSSKDAAAYGVFAESGSSSVVLSASTVNISAASAGTDSYAAAIAMNGGSVDIGKDGASVTLTVADGQEAISLKGGTLNLYGNISIPKGEINIDGGSATIKGNLTLDSLDRINPDRTSPEGKSIALNIDGKLTTTSDQIFKTAASETAASVGGLNDNLPHKIAFTSGSGTSLILTDPVVTYQYYKNAQDTYTGANAPHSIVMTGKMVDLTPENIGNLTNPDLPGSTLTWNSNLTIGANQISHQYAVVGDLDIGNGQTVTIDAGKDKKFTIGGNGENFITSLAPTVEVVVKSEGELQIGGTDLTQNGTINGNLTAESNATVTIKGALGKPITTINIAGTLTADANAQVTVDENAHVTVSEVNIAHGATFTVGAPDQKGKFGKLIASTLKQFGILFIDPDWSAEASVVAAENPLFNENSSTIVGQNSQLILGSSDAGLLASALEQGGKTFAENGITAAVYIAKPINLNGGSIVVNGALNEPESGAKGTVLIADNALLAAALDNDTALGREYVISGAELNLESKSYVFLDMANVTEYGDLNIQLAEKVTGLEDLSEDQIKLFGKGASLWYGIKVEGGKITASYDPVQKMEGLIAPNTFRAVLMNDTPYAATIRELLAGGDLAAATRQLNRSAAVGAAAGTQIVALNASSMITDTVEKHGSVLAGYAHEKAGPDLWIDLNSSFSKADSYSVGSASYGYKSDLAGATFGADYAFGNGLAAGAAFSIGTGSLRGQNLGGGVKNSVDYYGANLYGVWSTEYANVLGTVGYLHTKNKVSSHLGSKTKPYGNALTVAVRAEKPFALTPAVSVTPHVGVRYVFTDIEDFKQGEFKFTNKKTNLVRFPVGVAVNANLKAPCGAEVKPFLDLTVEPTAGDRKAKNKFGLASGLGSDSLNTRVADNALYSAKVGINATKGGHTFGLNYSVGRASHGRLDQQLQAGYRYAF